MNRLEMVKEFHEVYGQVYKDSPDISDKNLNKLRLSLLEEELKELEESLDNEDLLGTLDALVDLEYVLLGAVLGFGFQNIFDKAFREVHRSNLSKLDENGKPVYRKDGKVLKGPNYKKPDLETILGE